MLLIRIYTHFLSLQTATESIVWQSVRFLIGSIGFDALFGKKVSSSSFPQNFLHSLHTFFFPLKLFILINRIRRQIYSGYFQTDQRLKCRQTDRARRKTPTAMGGRERQRDRLQNRRIQKGSKIFLNQSEALSVIFSI